MKIAATLEYTHFESLYFEGVNLFNRKGVFGFDVRIFGMHRLITKTEQYIQSK